MPLRDTEGKQDIQTVTNGHNDNPTTTTIQDTCASLATKVNTFLREDVPTQLLKQVQEQTRIALGVIDEALEKYSFDELSLSYNGGKDCLVLLILLLASLSNHSSKPNATRNRTLPAALQTVYIISKHPFAEVDAFVDLSVKVYSLDLARYAMPMKEGFKRYLEDKKRVKAILVGTRRTDPHGEHLTHFDMTDSGWPEFMRVHPVIDWHYAEIWAFIRHLQIPYCILYDQGYTSLGGTTDTHPNPALKAGNGNQASQQHSKQSFRPAYELVEDEAERLGRDW